MAIDQGLDAVEETEVRILQVHGVDRLRRHRNRETFARHDPLFAETDNAGDPPARTGAVDAVEIDEVDRFVRTLAVRDAAAQACADEREVRVAVARFSLPLFLGELLAQVQLVVSVAGPLREHGLECAQVRRHAVAPRIQS